MLLESLNNGLPDFRSPDSSIESGAYRRILNKTLKGVILKVVPLGSEAERESGVTERGVQGVPIEAQSAAVARATASICVEERRPLGGPSGHVRFPLSLVWTPPACQAVDSWWLAGKDCSHVSGLWSGSWPLSL